MLGMTVVPRMMGDKDGDSGKDWDDKVDGDRQVDGPLPHPKSYRSQQFQSAKTEQYIPSYNFFRKFCFLPSYPPPLLIDFFIKSAHQKHHKISVNFFRYWIFMFIFWMVKRNKEKTLSRAKGWILLAILILLVRKIVSEKFFFLSLSEINQQSIHFI